MDRLASIDVWASRCTGDTVSGPVGLLSFLIWSLVQAHLAWRRDGAGWSGIALLIASGSRRRAVDAAPPALPESSAGPRRR